MPAKSIERGAKQTAMNIPKAIEILQHQPIFLNSASDHDFCEAIRLGIEALKRTQQEREHSLSFAGELLPGETEVNPDEN